jgi:hypothetical protein
VVLANTDVPSFVKIRSVARGWTFIVKAGHITTVRFEQDCGSCALRGSKNRGVTSVSMSQFYTVVPLNVIPFLVQSVS